MNKFIWPAMLLLLLVTSSCSKKLGIFNFDLLARRDNLDVQEITYNYLAAKGKLRFQLGTVVALLTAPPLIRSNGWESVFYLYGGLGILWGVLWMLLARDKPQVRRSAR